MIRNSMMKSGTNFLNTLYVQRDDPMISEGSFMQAKHLCVLIHIRIKGEVGNEKAP